MSERWWSARDDDDDDDDGDDGDDDDDDMDDDGGAAGRGQKRSKAARRAAAAATEAETSRLEARLLSGDALAHLKSAFAGHQFPWSLRREAVHVRARAVAVGEHVAEALGGHERHAG